MVYMTLFAFLRCYIPILTFWGIFGPKIQGFGSKMHTPIDPYWGTAPFGTLNIKISKKHFLPHRPDDYTFKRKR